LDEAVFQELLSAAYVMQEHNLRLKKGVVAKPAYAAKTTAAPVSEPPAPKRAPLIAMPAAAPQTIAPQNRCSECGSTLAAGEFFCAACGAPVARGSAPGALQKSWASLWDMHHASGASTAEIAAAVPAEAIPAAQEVEPFPEELEEIVGKFAPVEDVADAETENELPAKTGLALVPPAARLAPAAENTEASPQVSPWASAAKARTWLESLRGPQTTADWLLQMWRLHWGDISIALAATVLLVIAVQWFLQVPPATASDLRPLSLFEQTLVSLGLAEPPPATALPAPGNPNTKVWVDTRTALYYCPGAELYGKSPDGKIVTQREAQRDHFQPSTLRACD
jgi:hypothetical protein